MAAEHFQRRCHLGDLVAAADLYLLLQLTLGQRPHPAGQPPDAAQQHSSDEQPADQAGAGDADDADDDEEDPGSVDGLRRVLGGFGGPALGYLDDGVDLVEQVDGYLLVLRQQQVLALDDLQSVDGDLESAAVAAAQSQQVADCRPQSGDSVRLGNR